MPLSQPQTTPKMELKLVTCLMLAAVCGGVFGQGDLKIPRNTDDCIFPAIAANAVNMYPNSNYYIQGTKTIKPGDGSTQVVNQAKFYVKYFSTYKVVTNDVVQETYYLYHCGSSPPTDVPAGAKLFQIPLRSVSADDTSAADFMKQLNLMDRVAFASELAVSGCFQNLTSRCGYIAPDPHYNSGAADDIANQVDAFATYDKNPTNPKAIAFTANGADTPLLRSEWFKYAALFFNKDIEGNRLYGAIRNTYNAVSRSARATAAMSGTALPVVVWIYKGWDADYVVSKPKYKLSYVEDAGGVMLSDATLQGLGMTRKSDGVSWSIPQIEQAKWLALLGQADIIIDETYSFATGNFVTLDSDDDNSFLNAHKISATDAANIKAITNRRVYTLAGTTGQTIIRPDSPSLGSLGMDWFERGASRCDEAIKDFVKVITPTTPQVANWKLKWLLQLDYQSNPNRQRPVRVNANCNSATAQFDKFCKRIAYVVRACPNAVRDCVSGKMKWPSLSPTDTRCAAVSAQKDTIRKLRQTNKTATCAVA